MGERTVCCFKYGLVRIVERPVCLINCGVDYMGDQPGYPDFIGVATTFDKNAELD
ncbi:MAG: hypothetical protein KAV45_14140 [Calditrichia bacterium]|nr:hypothetical protein [Calditrichia bacterium]